MLQYGWHGARALVAQINELDQQWVWREYMAVVAYSIGKITAGLSGNEYPLPTYNDLMKDVPKEDDDMSGQDIVNDLISRLRKEVNDGA